MNNHGVVPASLSAIAYPVQREEIFQDLNSPFTVEEVDEGLSTLHNGRANGFSGYPAELLRYAQDFARRGEGAPPHSLSPVLTDILNA